MCKISMIKSIEFVVNTASNISPAKGLVLIHAQYGYPMLLGGHF